MRELYLFLAKVKFFRTICARFFAELVLHACPMMYRDRSICLMVFAYFYERSQGIDSFTTNPTLINVVGAVLQLVIVTHNHI